MKKFAKLFTLGILTSLLASGCATITKGPKQSVSVESSPPGATVIVDGQTIGNTPLRVRLSRTAAHEVSIERPGYYSEQISVLPVPNRASTAFIRFGIDQSMGAHYDLTPASVQVELDPLILPDSVGNDPVGELAAKVLEVDDRLYQGEIDANEHRYILSRLLQFYQQK